MPLLKQNCFLISLLAANGHLWGIPRQSQFGANRAEDVGVCVEGPVFQVVGLKASVTPGLE